jgi:hypothetical protein
MLCITLYGRDVAGVDFQGKFERLMDLGQEAADNMF